MKRNYWPLFFIGIFSFVFSMIIWTIVKTSQANLDEDESFLKSYQEVDDSYNNYMTSNKIFNEKYDLLLSINGKVFPLTIEDIMYSQRVLEKKSKHKNLFKLGSNELSVYILDKETNEKKETTIELKITKSNVSLGEFILRNEDFDNQNNIYKTNFKINEENNWNITGSFKIGKDMGYIYIKTNAS
jgi:hypothetical protein